MSAIYKNIAILLAGGEGKRVGGDVPKQLHRLADGRTVLETCIDTFQACPMIDDIWVVMHRDWLLFVPQNIHTIEGGKERWESSYRAVQAVSREYETEKVNVWIHDVARPFVSQSLLRRIGEAIEKYEAVSVAVPATDTIYQVSSSSNELTLQSIPLRSTIMRAQTPQAFRLSVIQNAFETALTDSSS